MCMCIVHACMCKYIQRSAYEMFHNRIRNDFLNINMMLICCIRKKKEKPEDKERESSLPLSLSLCVSSTLISLKRIAWYIFICLLQITDVLYGIYVRQFVYRFLCHVLRVHTRVNSRSLSFFFYLSILVLWHEIKFLSFEGKHLELLEIWRNDSVSSLNKLELCRK